MPTGVNARRKAPTNKPGKLFPNLVINIAAPVNAAPNPTTRDFNTPPIPLAAVEIIPPDPSKESDGLSVSPIAFAIADASKDLS